MIQVGERIPDILLTRLHGDVIETVNLLERIKDKKVIIFAVPGAFTPTCSNIHLPSFVREEKALKARGVEEIFCISVNDPYVLDVWEKVTHATGKITLLSDGNGAFTRAMGLAIDDSKAFGVRSQRYVAVVEDGIVQSLSVEENPGTCTITCAEEIIKFL
jgi:cytochrome c peroxidase